MADEVEVFVDVAPSTRIQTVCLGDAAASKLAFIAHPLGRLGGSSDDRVVRALAALLHQKHGYTTVLVNSRGVGQSTGSPSYSCIPEAQDFSAVVQHYLSTRLAVPAPSRGVLLCGYSAGCLSAICCDPPSTCNIRYLLISYPVSVMWALTLFRSSPFATALQRAIARESSPLLSLRGDRDQFTGDASYSAWEAGFSEGKKAMVESVAGADHFWSGKRCLEQMLQSVSAWLEGKASGTL